MGGVGVGGCHRRVEIKGGKFRTGDQGAQPNETKGQKLTAETDEVMKLNISDQSKQDKIQLVTKIRNISESTVSPYLLSSSVIVVINCGVAGCMDECTKNTTFSKLLYTWPKREFRKWMLTWCGNLCGVIERNIENVQVTVL